MVVVLLNGIFSDLNGFTCFCLGLIYCLVGFPHLIVLSRNVIFCSISFHIGLCVSCMALEINDPKDLKGLEAKGHLLCV